MTKETLLKILSGDFNVDVTKEELFEELVGCKRENDNLRDENGQLEKQLEEAYDEITRINEENY